MSDEPEADYDPPPNVTLLTGEELPVTDQMRARTFWSLRRYASYVYAERCAELLREFTKRLEAWGASNPDKGGFIRHALDTLDPALDAFDEALDQLGKGYVGAGYEALARAVVFHHELIGRGFEGGLDWVELGYGLGERPSTGLFLWAERAIGMARRIDHTLSATWTYTRLLTDHPAQGLRPRKFPPDPAPLPEPSGDELETGDVVDITGIYVPLEPPGGAPNFLVEGTLAPPVTRETARVDFIDYSDYEYGEEPGRWKLAWEDTRYRMGLQPYEDDFLNEDNELPT